MKIIGVVPARMGSSRFPGKPLHPIAGLPMVEHCIERARAYRFSDELFHSLVHGFVLCTALAPPQSPG